MSNPPQTSHPGVRPVQAAAATRGARNLTRLNPAEPVLMMPPAPVPRV